MIDLKSMQILIPTPKSVTLVAVSKKQPLSKILALYAVGQRHFGESTVQEALPKISAVLQKNITDITWHFIGSIQSNKTADIANNFSWVHSLSRLNIAQLLNQYRPIELGPLNVCIQVNIDHSPTKSGIPLRELNAFAEKLVQLPNLKFRGLMTIPQAQTDFRAQCRPFRALHEAFEQLKAQGYDIDTLSMGMSDDYQAAIAEGATMIRLGSALFGDKK